MPYYTVDLGINDDVMTDRFHDEVKSTDFMIANHKTVTNTYLDTITDRKVKSWFSEKTFAERPFNENSFDSLVKF